MKATFDAAADTREELAALLERAAGCVREGETEVGGYSDSDFNLFLESEAGDESEDFEHLIGICSHCGRQISTRDGFTRKDSGYTRWPECPKD